MSVHLTTDDQSTWSLQGELTFTTVPGVEQETGSKFQSPPTILDLSRLDRIDSAGLALLIEWSRQARLAGGDLTFANAPKGLLSLIEMANLGSVFKLDGA